MDVTEWLVWFLDTLHRAVDQAQYTLDHVLTKTRFWQRLAAMPLNERQVKLLNKLLDGFEGKLTSSKWAAIAKCSPDTALRDINDLLARGVLMKMDGGGRSTGYVLVGAFLGFLARDIVNHPERLQSVDAQFVQRHQSLTGGIEVDLDAPLSADDE